MTVTAPDDTVWLDAAAVTDAVLDVLRLAGDDVDADRIADLVPAAGARINDYLDRPDTDPVPAPPPAPLVDAINQVVLELYQRKSAPPSSVDALVAASWRPPSVDPLAAVRAQLSPYKRRRGIG